MSAIPDLCQPGQKDLMTCPYYVSPYNHNIVIELMIDYILLFCYPFRSGRSGKSIRDKRTIQESDVCFPSRSWINGHRLGSQEEMAK
jgi:hypothetical protein